MIDLALTQRTSLTIDECQDIFGVGRKTIYNWLTAGHLVKADAGRVDIDSVRARLVCLTPPGLSGSVSTLHTKTA
jgi:F420-0:gamma-glutamyl ligase